MQLNFASFTLTASARLVTASVVAVTTTTPMTNRDKTGFDPHDPLFRQLVAGIFYSKQLVATYYLVAIATIAVFTAVNYISSFRRWRHIKQHRPLKDGSTCSDTSRAIASRSSSATLCDYNTLALDEHSPLLKEDRIFKKGKDCSHVCSAVRSWLVIQPVCFPTIGLPLPANSALAFLLIYLAINVFYLLFNIQFSVDMLFVLSDRAAVLFATNLPILYTLSAKTQPFRPLIGYSHASLNFLHRRLGEWMIILTLLHGGLMFVVWGVTLRPKGYLFTKFITDKVTIFGLCALLCYQLIYLTSLARLRKVVYEIFLAAHVTLQVAALGFLYLHHSKSRPYVAVSLSIWAVDRFFCRALLSTRTFQATLTIMADGQTVGLKAKIPLHRTGIVRRILGLKTVQHGWGALDHIFIRIPALGKTKVLQLHPFSIASKPPRLDQEMADLDLIIRARNGFTKSLLNYAREHGDGDHNKNLMVHIEGPYGTNSGLQLLKASTTRVLFAGGSGIATIWPLLLTLVEKDTQCLEDLESGKHASIMCPIFLIWVVRNAEQYSWINKSEFMALKDKLGINLLMPTPTEQGGRPDIGSVLAECLSVHCPSERIGVVCSGPDSMTSSVRNECSKLIKSGRSLEVEVEKYAW